MSQNEHLSEELNDTERLLVTLAPRASRIDRDRLMIALGEQSAARGSTPWKWATGASLMLALALGVRPAFESPVTAPAQIAVQSETAPQSAYAEAPRRADPEEVVPREAERPVRDEADWLMALASGRYDSSRTLSVRPGLALDQFAVRGGGGAVVENSTEGKPVDRRPTLRWSDRLLERDAVEPARPKL